ncbi:MAG TPA: HAD-IIIA family hydrolase, partial [Pyrinomonadaceae bacterium]|nr:HAD-IIIA family hydrolase [Pyrinomonadaceae bacterium]
TFLTLGEHHEPARCDEFHRLFVERADSVMVDLTNLYDSVPTAVEALAQQGLKLGIVSTKYRRRITAVLERETVAHHFQVVIGGDDVKQHKPHPQGLLEAIERLECSPASVVYVGDSLVDAEVAKRAGVPLIVVLSGVTSRAEFDLYEPLAVLKSIGELPEFLRSNRVETCL